MNHPAIMNDKLAFSPQLSPADLPRIAALGYELLICNRPDDEADYQPSIDSISQAATDVGLSVVFAPIANNQFTAQAIEQTAEALAENKKTLMFCRTGTRSIILWAIIQLRHGADADTVFRQTAQAGYDLSASQANIQQIVDHLKQSTP